MSPSEPNWFSAEDAIRIHAEVLERSEGTDGIRSTESLEGAVERPRMIAHYEGCDDLFRLAAILCESIARSHAFVDGNKRTALFSAVTFLSDNGRIVSGLDDDVADIVIGIVERTKTVDDLTEWFRDACEEKTPCPPSP